MATQFMAVIFLEAGQKLVHSIFHVDRLDLMKRLKFKNGILKKITVFGQKQIGLAWSKASHFERAEIFLDENHQNNLTYSYLF